MSIFGDPYEDFLFDYLIVKLENGSNTKQALDIYQQQIPSSSPLKNKLQKVIEDLESGKLKFEEILLIHKMINEFQYGIIKHSTSTIDGIKLIRSMNQSNASLLVHMIYPILLPLLVIISTFYALSIYLGILEKELSTIGKVTPLIYQFVSLPVYFNFTFVYSGLLFFIFLTLFIFLGYIYTHQYKPAWIYRILKTQVYSDGRFTFKMILEMLKVGIPLHNIAQLLAKDYGQVGLRSFFDELSNTIQSGKPIYTVFEKYNFPPLLTIDVKISELNQIGYLEIIEGLYKTSQAMYDKSIEYIKIQWYLIFWMVAFLVVVVIGSDMINLLVSSFTFKLLYS